MVQLRDRAAQLVKHLEPVDKADGLEKIFTTAQPLGEAKRKASRGLATQATLGTQQPGESLESITRDFIVISLKDLMLR